jgi:hypothetical protein
VDEQRTFEAVRLRQVHDEVVEAVGHHDSQALARLVAEVEQPGWAEPPSPSLLQALRKAVLAAVATRLEEACHAGDAIRGRLARREWDKLAATAALARDDPIAQRAQPALDWLGQEDRRAEEDHQHEAALTALDRTVDYPGFLTPGELKRLAHAVTRHGRGMPDALQQRYISRLRAAEAQQSRRFSFKVGAASVVLFLAGTLVYYVCYRQARAWEGEKVATSISDMLELGEIEHAAGVLKDLEAQDPALLAYARMIEVRQWVEVARSQEAERALQFEQALRTAQAAPASAKAPQALETARSLARLATEKAALEHLEQRRAAELEAEQIRQEKELDHAAAGPQW